MSIHTLHTRFFDSLVDASVEAMLQNEQSENKFRWAIENHGIQRSSYVNFLWTAYRELDEDCTLGWANLNICKNKNELVIEVLSSRNPKKVHMTFSFSVDPNNPIAWSCERKSGGGIHTIPFNRTKIYE
ncbi:MAG: hypothetical protein M1503_02370 [Thaumarchaeota archaeon]|nr:hypothetical protein [Nitrososphaerota archaeon]MCL5317097.1 hypothetical protein [Nitrososphaerota archaeon]